MGVVHNRVYFDWFEVGRTELCRRAGISYKEIEESGYFLVVVEARCRYRRALNYDDLFRLKVSLKELSPRKLVFAYEIFSPDGTTLHATGETVHVVTDNNLRLASLPQPIYQKLTPFVS
ncbi:MAG: acyl-CoA thioesterase [Candidatus Aminicenantes bacterium]|nr:MAG: acyl-CoA thioesterase [Candidatus Aminicenantes bacterium]RLE05604.1 MAG: acyl-CoA thioesterase [Candidatus Aminicenantes bacterium]